MCPGVVSGARDEKDTLLRELTIVIPALNEADRIGPTVSEVLETARSTLDRFEIIVVDDGSSDGTYDAALRAAEASPEHVRIVRQPVNLGVGAAYRLGLESARFAYLTLVPGDRAFSREGLHRVFSAVGSAELIVSYRSNPQARTALRCQLSRLATMIARAISGKSIRDAHSLYVFPVALARRIPVSSGYSYHLEALCRLLRRVPSFAEVPVELNPKPDASSGVMRWRTVTMLGLAALKLAALRLTGRLN
jgi:glycosyltransferase involved in cell wall biosynthesis